MPCGPPTRSWRADHRVPTVGRSGCPDTRGVPLHASTQWRRLLAVVHPTWSEALAPVTTELAAMADFLRHEDAKGRRYLPAQAHILRAFAQPFDDVRVVVVGQDP